MSVGADLKWVRLLEYEQYIWKFSDYQSRNNFRTDIGCVLITKQNLQKFEFLKVHSIKIQIFANFAGW